MLATLQDAGNTPVDVAVSESTSTVAVANASGPSGSATVSVYRNGATTPTSTLTDPSAATGLGVAFDDGGNCYLLYDTNSGRDRSTSLPAAPERRCRRASRTRSTE